MPFCFNLNHHWQRLYRNALTNRVKKCLSAVLFTSLMSGVSACSLLAPAPLPRGSVISQNDIKALQVGSTSKADAIEILGSPTTYATFDPNNWIYISMMTKVVPLSYPGISKQHVLSLHFDQKGTLTKIENLSKKDAKSVTMVSDTTPTPGTKGNFWAEFFGNIGQYSPLSAMGMGSTFGPTGAGSGPFGSNPAMGTGPGSSGNTLQ